jgi:hypothetical protein
MYVDTADLTEVVREVRHLAAEAGALRARMEHTDRCGEMLAEAAGQPSREAWRPRPPRHLRLVRGYR